MILIIRISLMSRTVLVPNLAALEALVICEILAAFLPPPVRYCETQIKSRAIVSVEIKSNQK